MTIVQYFSSLNAALRIDVVILWFLITTATTMYMLVTKEEGSMSCVRALLSCLVLALMFVGSLYVWKTTYHRDHPMTIKKRCASVFVTSVWSPLFVYVCLSANHQVVVTSTSGVTSFWKLLGFRTECLLEAVVLPLALTMVLFAGPLVMRALEGVLWLYVDRCYWLSNWHNLVWIRNHVVAPFSEEFSFRACMLPILSQCLGNGSVIAICPLFFGVAHLHHMVDKVLIGYNVQKALLETVFQFSYTTVFGAYSAFLFLRTGHFVAPFVVHAFCNHMGFPDFSEVLVSAQPKRTFLISVFVLGLVSWAYLLLPMTNPSLYQNSVYWK